MSVRGFIPFQGYLSESEGNITTGIRTRLLRDRSPTRRLTRPTVCVYIYIYIYIYIYMYSCVFRFNITPKEGLSADTPSYGCFHNKSDVTTLINYNSELTYSFVFFYFFPSQLKQSAAKCTAFVKFIEVSDISAIAKSYFKDRVSLPATVLLHSLWAFHRTSELFVKVFNLQICFHYWTCPDTFRVGLWFQVIRLRPVVRWEIHWTCVNINNSIYIYIYIYIYCAIHCRFVKERIGKK